MIALLSPGGKEQALLMVPGISPAALGYPIMPGSPITVSADRKSFSMKNTGNWVFIYTPTLVK